MKPGVRAGCLLAALLLLCSLCGCSRGIRFTTGLQDNVLFRLNKEECECKEAYVFILSQKKKYETSYSRDIWQVKIDDQTFDSYMMDGLVDFLARMKSMAIMAEAYDIVLSEEENAQLDQAANQYLSGLSAETIKATGLDLEAVREVFCDYYLANRIMSELSGDVNTEVSVDEARVIRIQSAFWSTEGLSEEEKTALTENVQAAAELAAQGNDLAAIVTQMGSGTLSTETIARGQTESGFETAAFSLSSGEASGMIRSGSGLYLIRCLSNYEEELTAKNIEKIIRSRKEARFEEYYEEFLKTIVAEYNEKASRSISFAEDYGTYSTDFYEVYSSFLSEEAIFEKTAQ